MVVVFPAAFGPRKPTTSPFATSNETFWIAVSPPYRFVSPCALIKSHSSPDRRAARVYLARVLRQESSRARTRVDARAQLLAQQVEAEQRGEDRETGEKDQMRVRAHCFKAVARQCSPARERRLDAQPDERDGRLGEDRGGDP